MPKIPDSELQARLSREAVQASEKMRKLEEAITMADSRNKLLIDNAARKDIESYKSRRPVSRRDG